VDGALATYKKMIEMGVAREMARMVAPVARRNSSNLSSATLRPGPA